MRTTVSFRTYSDRRAFFRRRRGFTLIEALAALLIFGFLVGVFYRVFIASSAYMVNSRLLRGAVAAANERMEQYRNIPYNDIGTTAGSPVGLIVPDEHVAIDGLHYRVVTSVFFVDDPRDGVAPDDVLFEDYKRVSVTVVWGEGMDAAVSADRAVHDPLYSQKRVNLMSQFVPPGGIEMDVHGGVLDVNVLNGANQPLGDMPVTIRDLTRNHAVTMRTDNRGHVPYVGALPCQNCYEVTVGKEGYQTIRTEDGTAQLYTPTYMHQSVIQGQRTMMTMITDAVADLTVLCTDGIGDPVGGATLAVVGGCKVGADVAGNPIYETNNTMTADANGKIIVRTDTNRDGTVTATDRTDPGAYTFTVPSDVTDHVWFVDQVIADDGSVTIIVPPGAAKTVAAKFLSSEDNAIFAKISDADGPIGDAAVRVQGGPADQVIDLERTADAAGSVYIVPDEPVFFSDDAAYTVTVRADGYRESTQEVTINNLTMLSVTMEKL